MLSKKFRLPAPTRFSHPKTQITPIFIVKSQPNNLAINRFGFVVGKSIDKRAVVRNRAKRLIRSCIEGKWIKEGASSGKDVLFVVKKNTEDVEKGLLQDMINDVMGKI